MINGTDYGYEWRIIVYNSSNFSAHFEISKRSQFCRLLLFPLYINIYSYNKLSGDIYKKRHYTSTWLMDNEISSKKTGVRRESCLSSISPRISPDSVNCKYSSGGLFFKCCSSLLSIKAEWLFNTRHYVCVCACITSEGETIVAWGYRRSRRKGGRCRPLKQPFSVFFLFQYV